MAVLLQMTEPQRQYLQRLLCDECAMAFDTNQFELHAQLLDSLRAICAGRPVVITHAGRYHLVLAILRDRMLQGRSKESSEIIEKLTPLSSKVEAGGAEPWSLD